MLIKIDGQEVGQLASGGPAAHGAAGEVGVCIDRGSAVDEPISKGGLRDEVIENEEAIGAVAPVVGTREVATAVSCVISLHRIIPNMVVPRIGLTVGGVRKDDEAAIGGNHVCECRPCAALWLRVNVGEEPRLRKDIIHLRCCDVTFENDAYDLVGVAVQKSLDPCQEVAERLIAQKVTAVIDRGAIVVPIDIEHECAHAVLHLSRDVKALIRKKECALVIESIVRRGITYLVESLAAQGRVAVALRERRGRKMKKQREREQQNLGGHFHGHEVNKKLR